MIEIRPSTARFARRTDSRLCRVLWLAMGFGFAAVWPVCVGATPFDQRLIDQAVARELHAFRNDLQNAPMAAAKAIYFMALVAHRDPTATASDGTLVRDRLLSQFRSLITGGREPNANGSLSGWTHGSIAHAFALARHTPLVWTQLTDEERSRIEWLMRAMAIAAHFNFDDDNDYRTGVAYEGNFHKQANPNYREAYMGVLIAARLFFGAEELNTIFLSFDYAVYHAQFTEFGFSNVLARWDNATNGGLAGGEFGLRSVLENGGKARAGDVALGEGRGVRNRFTYQGVGLEDPFALFKKLADYMYGPDDTEPGTPWSKDDTVTNELWSQGKRVAWTHADAISPFTGERGMALEFRAHQGSSPNLRPRSSLKYVADGWNNSITTRATLQALGFWAGSGERIHQRDEIEGRMHVGSEDFLFKAGAGYHAVHGGATLPMLSLSSDGGATLNAHGFDYNREIWQRFLRWLPGRLNFAVDAIGVDGHAAYESGELRIHLSDREAGDSNASGFVFQSLQGDGVITAQVIDRPSGSSGVALLEGIDRTSRRVMLTLDPDRIAHMLVRGEDGVVTMLPAAAGSERATLTATEALPRDAENHWVRLERIGNLVRGDVSAGGQDPEHWVRIGEVELAWPETIYGGVAHQARAGGTPGTIRHLSIVSLPAPWRSTLVGRSGTEAGHARKVREQFVVAGAGKGFGEARDEHRIVYQAGQGDAEICARILSVERTRPDSLGGLMIRGSLDAAAPFLAVHLQNGAGLAVSWRTEHGARVVTGPALPAHPPYWLRLQRSGGTVTASVRADRDDSEWVELDRVDLNLRPESILGFVSASGASDQLSTSVFDQVSVAW